MSTIIIPFPVSPDRYIDAMEHTDTGVDISDFIEVPHHQLQRDQAGIDEMTAVDSFIGLQGSKSFIVGEEFDDPD